MSAQIGDHPDSDHPRRLESGKSVTVEIAINDKSTVSDLTEQKAAIAATIGTADNPTIIKLGADINISPGQSYISLGNAQGAPPQHIEIDGEEYAYFRRRDLLLPDV